MRACSGPARGFAFSFTLRTCRLLCSRGRSLTLGIYNQSSLNTSSTDRANRRLVNTSISLNAYPLETYYVPGRLNIVPDALSRLRGKDNEATRKQNEKPVLDTPYTKVLFLAEARMVMIPGKGSPRRKRKTPSSEGLLRNSRLC